MSVPDRKEQIYIKDFVNIFSGHATILQDLNFSVSDTLMKLPFMLLHSTGVYAFRELTETSAIENELSSLHSFLRKKSSAPGSAIFVYGYKSESDTFFYAYDYYSDTVKKVKTQDFADGLFFDFENRSPQFSEQDISYFEELFASMRNKHKRDVSVILSEKDDKRYIKRNGNIYPLSDVNTNTYYVLLLFGGLFGIHKFYLKKWFKGISYLFTCGFFGVAWLFDLISLFLNRARDRKGFYLNLLSKKKGRLFLTAFWLIPSAYILLNYFSLIIKLPSLFSVPESVVLEIYKFFLAS